MSNIDIGSYLLYSLDIFLAVNEKSTGPFVRKWYHVAGSASARHSIRVDLRTDRYSVQPSAYVN